MAQNDNIGIALFGFGRMGSIHALNCLQKTGVDLKYIVELPHGMTAAEDFCRKNSAHAKVITSADVGLVLGDNEVKAVIIATVTSTHETLILNCLHAGKAVLCEKPLASTYEAVVNCYEEAEKAGLPLLCAFNRRFDATHRAVYDAVRAGDIGAIEMVKTCSRDSPLPPLSYIKVSGGMLRDCAIHDVDMVLWMWGDDDSVASVYAQGNGFIPNYAGSVGDIDTATISLKSTNGKLALVDISRNSSYGYDQRVEVVGSSGMLQSNNIPVNAMLRSNANGITGERWLHSFPTRFAGAYVNELEHFIDVIRNGTPLIVTKNSTLMADKVIDACEESLKTGLPVIIR